MSPIRPFEAGDIEAVTDLYLEVVRPGSKRPMPELCDYFEAIIFSHPWSDPDLPGLVYEQPGRGIVGFIASYSRRLKWQDETLNLACSGQLVAHPEYRNRGVGALLMRRYMKGPQDLTITDGATDEVREMWQRLGGRARHLASNSWTRVLAPGAYAGRLAARRLRRKGGLSGSLLAELDRLVVGRLTAPPAVETTTVEIGALELVEAGAQVARSFKLRPDYDEAFLSWLLAELEGTVERGRLLSRSVLDPTGRSLGYYLAFHQPDGVVQVLQIAAAPARSGAVLDRLLADAVERRAIAVEGRLEPHLYAAVRERGALLRRSEWALAHSSRPDLLDALEREDTLLTRLEGEWWMVPHMLNRPASHRGRSSEAQTP